MVPLINLVSGTCFSERPNTNIDFKALLMSYLPAHVSFASLKSFSVTTEASKMYAMGESHIIISRKVHQTAVN